MFASSSFRRVVAGEIVAIIVGSAALSASGHSLYVAAWVSAVVGGHFLAFGRLLAHFYYWVGALLLVGAVGGGVAGWHTASAGTVEATTGIIAAVTLLGTATWRIQQIADRI
jgi:hypothetical protein